MPKLAWMIDLSAAERACLGHPKMLKNGEESEFSHPTASMWKKLRAYLVKRSLASNPGLDPALTAYTPGETWGLLHHPQVAAWHQKMRAWRAPERYKAIAFVPCAKTKPWEGPAVSKSALYRTYNQLRAEQDQVCFVTVSEPLGVVPMQFWPDFPQYDNPGLFHDDALRSGLMSADWGSSPAGRKVIVPFDEEAYLKCVGLLGGEVGRFLAAHKDRVLLSFVDNADLSLSTHAHMLRVAQADSGVKVEAFLKKPVARQAPYAYIKDVLRRHGVRFGPQIRLKAGSAGREIERGPVMA